MSNDSSIRPNLKHLNAVGLPVVMGLWQYNRNTLCKPSTKKRSFVRLKMPKYTVRNGVNARICMETALRYSLCPPQIYRLSLRKYSSSQIYMWQSWPSRNGGKFWFCMDSDGCSQNRNLILRPLLSVKRKCDSCLKEILVFPHCPPV